MLLTLTFFRFELAERPPFRSVPSDTLRKEVTAPPAAFCESTLESKLYDSSVVQ